MTNNTNVADCRNLTFESNTAKKPVPGTTVISLADKRETIPRKIGKNLQRGTRSDCLITNPNNNSSYTRRGPFRTIVKEGELRYHNKIVEFLRRKNSDNSLKLHPTDLKFITWEKEFNSINQVSDHTKSTIHQNQVRNCTPKYCATCGIFWVLVLNSSGKQISPRRSTIRKFRSYRFRNDLPPNTDSPIEEEQ